MASALIGSTGFVGSNLSRDIAFTHQYNSRNIHEIVGQSFDIIYCAGVPAAKWLANRDPENDLRQISSLLVALEKVDVARFVLVSTIDVYKEPNDVTEMTPVSTAGLHPYGTHRRLVEQFVKERFPVHHIVRLPGLFGSGLKKNIVYDLLHDNQLENIHSDAVFQFYDLACLSRDITRVIDNNLDLVNFATEPVSVREVANVAFGRDFFNKPAGVIPPTYNMKTVHADIFSSNADYIQQKEEVLERMKRFVETLRTIA